MARGEIELARTLNPLRIGEYKDVKESRQISYLETIRKYKEEKKKGKVLGFDETATLDEKNIVTFAPEVLLAEKAEAWHLSMPLVYNLDFRGPHRISISGHPKPSL